VRSKLANGQYTVVWVRCCRPAQLHAHPRKKLASVQEGDKGPAVSDTSHSTKF
jgi:hypothetical protein